MKLDIRVFFENLSGKNKVSLKYDKNIGYFTGKAIHIFHHISLLYLESKMFQTRTVDKIKTHILCSITFCHPPTPGNRTVYEKMWKNIVQLDRPQTTIWSMCIAFLIPKATNIHSEYEIFILLLPETLMGIHRPTGLLHVL